MPPRYVSGVSTNVGTMEMPSKPLANTPFMSPAREKSIEVKSTAAISTARVKIAQGGKKKREKKKKKKKKKNPDKGAPPPPPVKNPAYKRPGGGGEKKLLVEFIFLFFCPPGHI